MTMRMLASLAAALCALLAGCPGPSDPEAEWQPAFDATDVGWLLSVWGSSGDDVYTVGGAPDDPNGAVAWHRDASGWAPVDLGVEAPLLNWVFGFGSNDVFVVGAAGTVLHWDGAAWARQDTPTDQDLWGVWGASPDDLWAVGGRGRAEGDAVILRYDGSAWAEVEAPALERPRVWAFFKVWGSSASDVWIVGQRGAVLRWNGSDLSEQPVAVSEDLISVWGTGPDRVAMVGGRNNGVIVTWDGSSFRNQNLAPLPGLNGVFLRTDDTVHVCGVEGTIAIVDFDTFEYVDQWQMIRTDYHAMFGDPSGRLTAVGGNFLSVGGPFMGVASERSLGADE